MAKRQLLLGQLERAWDEMLSDAYATRLINSERGLQVHFCAALLKQFSEKAVERKVFIEPKIEFDDGKNRHPDIVICNRDRIIGVVELKYKPRGRPAVDKDINTLLRICRAKGALTLANERYLGPSKPKKYVLAADAVLCWAGIYTGTRLDLPPVSIEEMGDRFKRLDGLTSKSANP